MNIFPPLEQRLDPFKFYAMMRESNPIAYDDKNKLWGVFRYYDVQSILGDYTHFSSEPPIPSLQKGKQPQKESRQMAFSRPSLLKSDPPYHRILRGVIASAFTPMAIARLESRIEDVANHLVDRVIKNGRMDLISDLAYPLPVTVIAELLGVPAEDHNIFQVWADKLVSSAGGELNEDSDSTKNLITIESEMDEYFGPIIDKRSKDPHQDLISSLIKAEADGNHLNKEEILAFCYSLTSCRSRDYCQSHRKCSTFSSSISGTVHTFKKRCVVLFDSICDRRDTALSLSSAGSIPNYKPGCKSCKSTYRTRTGCRHMARVCKS